MRVRLSKRHEQFYNIPRFIHCVVKLLALHRNLTSIAIYDVLITYDVFKGGKKNLVRFHFSD